MLSAQCIAPLRIARYSRTPANLAAFTASVKPSETPDGLGPRSLHSSLSRLWGRHRHPRATKPPGMPGPARIDARGPGCPQELAGRLSRHTATSWTSLHSVCP